ncbi:hypothetical protein, partial [Rubrivivax gelatinosus]|uniref:hypothetical protein n=1 Tax=Rubrivivax gelatinosus TaxID=28068 RepID=UPI001ED91D64
PAQQAAAPDARAAATATPYAGQIAAPVGSPDFAPGLSAQVSVMLRDGVQGARSRCRSRSKATTPRS